jgi:8-oxo-dGTP pyrophosphatase MutT (NUDIX family)
MIGIAARIFKHGYLIASMTFLERSPVPQAAALCYRVREGQLEILLITSRRSGRWGIPKGSIERGETSQAAAEREAYEEAGITGRASISVVGEYSYRKEGSGRLYSVTVHLLETLSEVEEFEEKGLRLLRWVRVEEAAAMVADPALREVILASGVLRAAC